MWRKRKSQDFKAEIQAHLELEADELRAEGLTPAEAHGAARRALGNQASVEERFYESSHWMLGGNLLRDLKFARRVLLKDAKFSSLALLGLALGIGASTAIFALVNTLVNAGIEKVRDPGSYVGFNIGPYNSNFSFAEYRYFQDHSTTLSEITAESGTYSFVLGGATAGADAEDAPARFESAGALAVRRLQPALGRIFSTEDEQPGSAPVAMLSYRFWQRRFAADAGILGKTILLNTHPATIVGVADSRFHEDDAAVLFLPLQAAPGLLAAADWLHDPDAAWLQIAARLRPGVTLPKAQAEANLLANAFERSTPSTSRPVNPSARKFMLSEGGANPERRRMAAAVALAIDCAVSMILLIACSNLASLVLARATVRRREIGVRLSLGASRGRLIRQLLTESLLLATLGGCLGLVFSSWLARWLFLSLGRPAYVQLHSDYHVLLYGLALSLATGLSFGLGPALAATKTNLARALCAEGLSGTPGSPSQKLWAPRNLLVVGPLAASLMLLIGAASMLRTARHAQFSAVAFDTSRMIGVSFRLKPQGYDEAKALQFQDKLRERISAMPGVSSVALATGLPLTPAAALAACQAKIGTPAASGGLLTACNLVSPGFFETLGVRPLRGRAFLPSDRQGSTPVAIVNQELVRRYWPNQEPIGKRIGSENGSVFFEVVGVVSNLYDRAEILPIVPTVYAPSGQGSLLLTASAAGAWNGARTLRQGYQPDQLQFLVRANGSPAPVKAALRQAVHAADSSLWVNIQTIEERLEPFTGPMRTTTLILSVLGALVLLMAAVGIYALLAYAVSQRTREIGIRMALGAQRGEILSLVMQRTVMLILWGIGLGLAGALALNKILASMMHNTEGVDAVTFVPVALLLGMASLIASYLPARKALRVDPVRALRWE